MMTRLRSLPWMLFVASAALAANAPAPAPVLPFIEDDYAAALLRARATKVPLFVEAWAPW